MRRPVPVCAVVTRGLLASALALVACSETPDRAAVQPNSAPDSERAAASSAQADAAVAFPALAVIEGDRVQELDLNPFVGRLVREGRCLRLVPDRTSFVALPPGAGSALVVWPTGATLDGDTVRAPGAAGFVVGGPVVLDGFNRGWHSVAEASALGLTEPIPADCGGPYWVAGSVLGETVPPPPPRPPPPPAQ